MPHTVRLPRLALRLATALALLLPPCLARSADVRADGPPLPRAPAPAPAPPLAHPPGLDSTWSAGERARLAFLEHLGWRFVADANVKSVTVEAGTPGQRTSIAEAQAAGDLRVRLPADPAANADLRGRLEALADGIPSRLAWQHRMEAAVRTATGKFIAAAKAGRFKFPPLLFWESPWFQFHPPQPQWAKRDKIYVVESRPSQAIEAFYTRGGQAECYTAQWLVAYAAQYELHGAEAFDETFRGEEIVVGRPSDVRPTPIGQTMRAEATYPYRALLIPPDRLSEDPGRELARHGPKAFAALTGIVRLQDETDGGNQNITTISVSPRACEVLRTRGIAYVSELGRRAAAAHKARGRLRGGREAGSASAEYERILADPVLSEWIVYVQPFGNIPVANMFRREIEENDKPTYVLLYVHGREDEFFRRYRTTWERRRLRAADPTGAPGLPAPAR
jgi:hypothetical protein